MKNFRLGIWLLIDLLIRKFSKAVVVAKCEVLKFHRLCARIRGAEKNSMVSVQKNIDIGNHLLSNPRNSGMRGGQVGLGWV
jgi:hypothetical protein